MMPTIPNWLIMDIYGSKGMTMCSLHLATTSLGEDKDGVMDNSIREAITRLLRDSMSPGSMSRTIFEQALWSRDTFGPHNRTMGVLDHILKEVKYEFANPNDVSEWVDLIILSIDGAIRAAKEASPDVDDDLRLYWATSHVVAAYHHKMTINRARVWPDWRGKSTDEAIEHDRTFD